MKPPAQESVYAASSSPSVRSKAPYEESSQAAFDDWLRDQHAQMTTPSDLVAQYVRKAAHSPLVSSKRLIVGRDNEVYKVTTADGRALIVRVSHRDDPRFEAERWALDAVRAQGVPTPQVLLVEKAALTDHFVTFCIEEKMPGRPLDVLLKSGSKQPARTIAEIGAMLGRIHRVPVKGFGYLRPDGPDGNGWDIPFSAIMVDLLDKEAELAQAATRWSVPEESVTQGLALLAANTNLYQWNAPCLTHGDFGAAHILVDEEQITGVIDFQECSGNHPVFDFAHWYVHWEDEIPLSQLIASYQDSAGVLDERFEPLLHLALLRECLWMLMVRIRQNNPYDIQAFKKGIDKGLAFFSG